MLENNTKNQDKTSQDNETKDEGNNLRTFFKNKPLVLDIVIFVISFSISLLVLFKAINSISISDAGLAGFAIALGYLYIVGIPTFIVLNILIGIYFHRPASRTLAAIVIGFVVSYLLLIAISSITNALEKRESEIKWEAIYTLEEALRSNDVVLCKSISKKEKRGFCEAVVKSDYDLCLDLDEDVGKCFRLVTVKNDSVDKCRYTKTLNDICISSYNMLQVDKTKLTGDPSFCENIIVRDEDDGDGESYKKECQYAGAILSENPQLCPYSNFAKSTLRERCVGFITGGYDYCLSGEFKSDREVTECITVNRLLKGDNHEECLLYENKYNEEKGGSWRVSFCDQPLVSPGRENTLQTLNVHSFEALFRRHNNLSTEIDILSDINYDYENLFR